MLGFGRVRSAMCAAMVCGAVLAGVPAMAQAGAGGAAPDVGTTLHLELKVVRWPGGFLPGDLRAGHMGLVANGTRLPLRVDPAAGPTHLLVVVAGGPEAAQQALADGKAAHEIAAAFRAGWAVRVVMTDGRATNYARSAAEMAAGLAEGRSGAATVTRQDAIADLLRMPGRRVLVVGPGVSLKSEAAAMPANGPASAPRQMDDVYVVDGGVPGERVFDAPYLAPVCSSGPDLPNNCQATPSQFPLGPNLTGMKLGDDVTVATRQNGYRRQVWHGKTLGDALAQSMRDQRRHVTLAVTVPAPAAGARSAGGPWELALGKLPAGASVNVEAYTMGAGQQRQVLAQPLVLHE